MRDYYLGVVILESLTDPTVMDERAVVIRESDITAPPGDPYPVWHRRLVRIKSDSIMEFASDLARSMTEDFYNHFVDDGTLIVVFKGRHFVLNKYDKMTWQAMVEYGESVRVSPRWTLDIPVDDDKLL